MHSYSSYPIYPSDTESYIALLYWILIPNYTWWYLQLSITFVCKLWIGTLKCNFNLSSEQYFCYYQVVLFLIVLSFTVVTFFLLFYFELLFDICECSTINCTQMHFTLCNDNKGFILLYIIIFNVIIFPSIYPSYLQSIHNVSQLNYPSQFLWIIFTTPTLLDHNCVFLIHTIQSAQPRCKTQSLKYHSRTISSSTVES